MKRKVKSTKDYQELRESGTFQFLCRPPHGVLTPRHIRSTLFALRKSNPFWKHAVHAPFHEGGFAVLLNKNCYPLGRHRGYFDICLDEFSDEYKLAVADFEANGSQFLEEYFRKTREEHAYIIDLGLKLDETRMKKAAKQAYILKYHKVPHTDWSHGGKQVVSFRIYHSGTGSQLYDLGLKVEDPRYFERFMAMEKAKLDVQIYPNVYREPCFYKFEADPAWPESPYYVNGFNSDKDYGCLFPIVSKGNMSANHALPVLNALKACGFTVVATKGLNVDGELILNKMWVTCLDENELRDVLEIEKQRQKKAICSFLNSTLATFIIEYL